MRDVVLMARPGMMRILTAFTLKTLDERYDDLSAATVERDAIPLAFLCWSLTNITRFSRSGSRIYCRRKHFPFVFPL